MAFIFCRKRGKSRDSLQVTVALDKAVEDTPIQLATSPDEGGRLDLLSDD